VTTTARRRPRPPSNLTAVLLGAIPGLGHIYLDHYLLGAFLFSVFVTALNTAFLGATLQTLAHPEALRWAGTGVLVVTWILSVWHIIRLSYGTDRAALASQKRDLLREALLDYLRDDLENAARKLERAVALDVDWRDPDPLFHLGVTSLRLAERRARKGDPSGARQARRRAQWAFRTCLARDAERKWAAEIEAEMKRMRRRVSITGRLRVLQPGLDSVEMLPRLADLPAEGEAPADSASPEDPGAAADEPDEGEGELEGDEEEAALRLLFDADEADAEAGPAAEESAGRRRPSKRTSARFARRMRRILESGDPAPTPPGGISRSELDKHEADRLMEEASQELAEASAQAEAALSSAEPDPGKPAKRRTPTEVYDSTRAPALEPEPSSEPRAPDPELRASDPAPPGSEPEPPSSEPETPSPDPPGSGPRPRASDPGPPSSEPEPPSPEPPSSELEPPSPEPPSSELEPPSPEPPSSELEPPSPEPPGSETEPPSSEPEPTGSDPEPPSPDPRGPIPEPERSEPSAPEGSGPDPDPPGPGPGRAAGEGVYSAAPARDGDRSEEDGRS